MTHRLVTFSVGLVLASALAGVLSACGPRSSPGPEPSRSEPSGPLPATLGPPATLAPGATPLVRIDPGLLAVLPASVGGQTVLESREGDAAAETNASLASIAEAAVGALAIDLGPGDLVYALVVRLTPGALDEDGFRNWRDAYDQGACGGSGVGGHAQSEIGGRTVYVGTCVNGLHTYHAWIADRNLLISASSAGTREFGQELFANLRPD